jgi:hypothetical protein
MGRPNTSCEECQRQRLGCNAMSQPGRACLNCLRREVVCSMRSKRTEMSGLTKARASKESRPSRSEAPSLVSEPTTALGNINGGHEVVPEPLPALASLPPSITRPMSLSSTSDDLARHQQAWRLHQLLWNVFTAVLEPRIGLWIGGGGCPFTTDHPVRLGIYLFVDCRH